MARTLEQIDADIAKFQAALDDLLLGSRVQGMKHGEREVQYGSNFTATEKALKRRLFDLRHERSRITGERSPFAPIIPPIMS